MTAELTIFYNGGKTFIGYLCTVGGGEEPSFTGLGTSVGDQYVVRCPAEITYTLTMTADATADLTSHVMPLYPGGFVNGSKDQVYFAFPKATTVVSTLKSANLHTNIINQYNQLTGLG